MPPQVLQHSAAKRDGAVGEVKQREAQQLEFPIARTGGALDLNREMADPFGDEPQYFRGNDYY